MSYTPKAGSVAEAAIKFIEKSGSARSGDIARAIGVEQKSISPSLQAAIDNGVLVACDVVVPGKPPQKEYRIGGGMAAPKFRDFSVNPEKRPPRPESVAPANDRSPAGESQQSAAKSQPAAAKRSQKIPRNIHEGTPASPLKHFRCGLYSDGALRLEGDIDQDGDSFTLDPDQTRDLVGYLHRQEVLQ